MITLSVVTRRKSKRQSKYAFTRGAKIKIIQTMDPAVRIHKIGMLKYPRTVPTAKITAVQNASAAKIMKKRNPWKYTVIISSSSRERNRFLILSTLVSRAKTRIEQKPVYSVIERSE